MVDAEIFKILGILKDRFCNGQTQEMIIRHLITFIKHMSVRFIKFMNVRGSFGKFVAWHHNSKMQ